MSTPHIVFHKNASKQKQMIRITLQMMKQKNGSEEKSSDFRLGKKLFKT